MKHLLLLVALIICPFIIFSQTVTWNGASGIDNNWNTDMNWDSGSVPGVSNDVIIPDGHLVDIDTPGAEANSLDLQGSSAINAGFLTVTNTFNIAAQATLNWSSPSFITCGTINNLGTINVSGTVARNLGAGTILNNDNLIIFTGISDIFLNTNCVINNNIAGVIDFQSHLSGISKANVAPHILNNDGLIKSNPPLATDQVTINVQVNNNNGTFQVEKGTFTLANSDNNNTFTDGQYITFPGTTFNNSNGTTISGTLGGAINGTMNLFGIMTVPTTATFDFGGSEIIRIGNGIIGAGTVTNRNIILVDNSSFNIQGTLTLINQDTILFTTSQDLFIGTDSTLNNDVGGVIEFQGDNGDINVLGGPPNTFLNSGLIRTSLSDPSDKVTIRAELSNTGTIEINTGSFILSNTGISLNGGIYNIAVDGNFDWNLAVTLLGNLTGDIQGLLNWNNIVNINGSASLSFSGTQIINWSGNITNGGVLTNNNIMNIGNFNASIFGGTTLVNNNTINIAGDLFINDGTLNNAMMGTVNLLTNGSSIANAGLFDNFGNLIVDLPNATDNTTITSQFNNNNGTIQIESGILNLSNSTANAQNLFDGVYNIFPNGTFDWDNNLTLSGELTGTVNGPINWRSILWVNSPNTATFFFSGLKKIFWPMGSLNGGGTLINRSDIDITSTGNVNINGGTTFNNGGNLSLTTFGDLAVNTDGTINNLVEGVIEMQVPAGNILSQGTADSQTLNNLGTFNSDTGGINSVGINTNNSGLIDIKSGELEFSESIMLHNELTGIIKGTGILDIPSVANFTNDGTIAPGNSPGTLSVIGNYSSTPSAKLEIEINGLTQGTEFDFMPISSTTSANVVFDGIVDVTMGFDADVSDEFIISTIAGTGIISACNLQTPVMAIFGGNTYEFSVLCRNDNEVVLTVTNKTLSVDSFEFSEDSILLFPNPASDNITLKNISHIQLSNALLFDLQGSLIEDINLEGMGTQKAIHLRRLASGLYFIKINSDSNSITKMFVKR